MVPVPIFNIYHRSSFFLSSSTLPLYQTCTASSLFLLACLLHLALLSVFLFRPNAQHHHCLTLSLSLCLPFLPPAPSCRSIPESPSGIVDELHTSSRRERNFQSPREPRIVRGQTLSAAFALLSAFVHGWCHSFLPPARPLTLSFHPPVRTPSLLPLLLIPCRRQCVLLCSPPPPLIQLRLSERLLQ